MFIQVKLTVFVTYIKACTYYISFLVLLFVILSNAASLGSNFWLADYSNKNDAAAAANSTGNGTGNSSNATVGGDM